MHWSLSSLTHAVSTPVCEKPAANCDAMPCNLVEDGRFLSSYRKKEDSSKCLSHIYICIYIYIYFYMYYISRINFFKYN